MFESSSQPEHPTPRNESLDAEWYARLEQCGSFQAYEYLDGDALERARSKAVFISGEITNPTLDYPKLAQEKITSLENGLLTLKSAVLSREENEVVKQVYRWKINEKLAEARLLESAANGDMRRFRRYSEFIYGKPSEEIHAYTVNTIRSEAESALTSEDASLAAAAQDLLDTLQPKAPHHTFALPDKDALALSKDDTLRSLGDIVNIPIEKADLSADDIKSVFGMALETIKAEGWVVEITSTSKTNISINQEKHQVLVPDSRKLSVEAMRQLIAHEIGTHTLRRINGERTKLHLLGLGLDRYEAAEEGIATMREQSLQEKVSDFSGLGYHFAISLATGLDGTPRDFRKTYEILKKYYYFNNLSKKLSEKDASEKSAESAWACCVRIFRGTDCETPGVCFTKDIAYREGNIAIWDVIMKNRPEMARFNIGKYDPSNTRHLWVLEQLNITDEDLSRLEN